MTDAHPIRSGRPRLAAMATVLAGVVLAGIGSYGASQQQDGTPQQRTGPRTEFTADNPPSGLPAALTTGQRLDWSHCTLPTSSEGDRAGYECATMKAPLDYRRPDRKTIDVALIRKKATGPDERRIGSLVLNFGGPGVSGVTGLPDFIGQYEPLLDRYDLVSFDPRGVGATAPVRCGKTVGDDGYDGSEACAKHSGALLPYVGTSHTARDLDLMRYLLGDEQLHYYGVSYGATLGAVYAHLYPSHVGRLVLEAPADPTEDRVEVQLSQVKAVQQAFDRFAAYCAARASTTARPATDPRRPPGAWPACPTAWRRSPPRPAAAQNSTPPTWRTPSATSWTAARTAGPPSPKPSPHFSSTVTAAC
ncbi:alpha/beta fold hydrolase [Streptomyces sp. NPDC005262]|uniref:alpha/beta fold hydrolase n=1 Tax=Streptomyces sp. NPDC005262 TaxID=3364710 RepID=UPI0036993CB6